MKTKSKKAKGYLLDIGLTETVQQNFMRMGTQKSKDGRTFAADLVHDIERFPWPLESNSCLIVLAAHIVEHIKP